MGVFSGKMQGYTCRKGGPIYHVPFERRGRRPPRRPSCLAFGRSGKIHFGKPKGENKNPRERSRRPPRLRAEIRGDTRAFLEKFFVLGAGHAAHKDLRVDSLTKKIGEAEISPFLLLWATCSRREMSPPCLGRNFGERLEVARVLQYEFAGVLNFQRVQR